MMKPLLYYALLLTAMAYMLVQVRKPGRWTGRLLVWLMNLSHSGLTDWGLTHATIEKHFTILDVGCGGGRTIQKLAAFAPQGKIYGIDYSPGSVAASRVTNKQLIQAEQVEIKQAPVSALPFPACMFDLVTAVETHYYWPNLVKDMQEILRVLKPGGALIVIAESYRNGKYDKLQRPVMKLLKSSHLSADEHRELFEKAGFTRRAGLCRAKERLDLRRGEKAG
jgi:SAM-dependent methyltransferase